MFWTMKTILPLKYLMYSFRDYVCIMSCIQVHRENNIYDSTRIYIHTHTHCFILLYEVILGENPSKRSGIFVNPKLGNYYDFHILRLNILNIEVEFSGLAAIASDLVMVWSPIRSMPPASRHLWRTKRAFFQLMNEASPFFSRRFKIQ